MSRSFNIYGYWQEANGRHVKIDGHAYKLRVNVDNAVYPYPQKVIRVYADPINKNAAWYQKIKRELGDDWSTDVLESDVELTCSVASQLWRDGIPER